MAGQMNRPEWLKPGTLVKVPHWHGIVEDVAISSERVMVLIKSAKGIWRNQRDASEWLEYIEGQIVPAASDEFAADLAAHADRIRKMLTELEAFAQEARDAA